MYSISNRDGGHAKDSRTKGRHTHTMGVLNIYVRVCLGARKADRTSFRPRASGSQLWIQRRAPWLGELHVRRTGRGGKEAFPTKKYIYIYMYLYLRPDFSFSVSFVFDSNTTVQLPKLHLAVSWPLDDDGREVQRWSSGATFPSKRLEEKPINLWQR